MDGGGAGIPEPVWVLIIHPYWGLGQGTEIVWGFKFGFRGGKNLPRTRPVAMPTYDI